MRKIFDNFDILTFFLLNIALLNIALPTVDVIKDILMIINLFRGAQGCVNPRIWSEEHRQWQTCLEDPETFAPIEPLEAPMKSVNGQPQGSSPGAAGTRTSGLALGTTKTGKLAEKIQLTSVYNKLTRP